MTGLSDHLRRLFAPRPGARFGASGVTRRDLAVVAAGGVLTAVAPAAAALPSRLAGMDRRGLDMLVRGLAGVEQAADPALSAQAAAMLSEIAEVLPEAPQLFALYRAYPAGRSGYAVRRPEAEVNLAVIERAIDAAEGLHIGYTDLHGHETVREIWPLALVHPDHGIFVMAWCRMRQGYRKFFAHSLAWAEPSGSTFAAERTQLLAGLVAQETARQV